MPILVYNRNQNVLLSDERGNSKVVATLALGSRPKQGVAKLRAKRRAPGVMSHAPMSARECEGINPHTQGNSDIGNWNLVRLSNL